MILRWDALPVVLDPEEEAGFRLSGLGLRVQGLEFGV